MFADSYIDLLDRPIPSPLVILPSHNEFFEERAAV